MIRAHFRCAKNRCRSPRISVTLVEASPTFTACPLSNAVLGGLRELKVQQFGYDKVRAAGVNVTIADYADMVHCFIYLQGVLPQAHDAMAKAATAMIAPTDKSSSRTKINSAMAILSATQKMRSNRYIAIWPVSS